MTESDTSHGKRPLTVLAGCGGLLALAAAALVLGHLLTGQGRDDLMTRWDTSFGTWQETLDRWPSRPTSIEAVEVERRAAEIGVDIAPRGSGRAVPDPVKAKTIGDLRGPMSKYLQAQVESATRRVAAPPDEVRGYLTANRQGLDALYTRLRSGQPPRWERHLEAGVMAPIPNLLGHINLQRVILVDVLDAIAAGHRERALDGLEASWSLNEAIRDEPLVIELLIALNATRQQAGVLRLVPAPPEVWIERMGSIRYTDRVIQAMALDGRIMVEVVAGSGPGTQVTGLVANAAQTITGPYQRLCATDSGAVFLDRMVRLAEVDYVCDRDLAPLGASFAWESPWWNKLGDSMLPNLLEAVRRASRTDFDAELTARLMQLDLAAVSGEWSAGSVPTGSPVACPEDRWVLRTSPDGDLEFGISRPIEWDLDITGPTLPQSYSAASALVSGN